MAIRVLIADDHKIVRQGLRALLDAETDIEVVGEATDGRTAVRRAKELRPNAVILDVGMPELNGMDACRQTMAAIPEANVLALSMHSDKQFVRGMLEAGASGYLLKHCAFEELARAVRTVAGGKTYLSPEIGHLVLDDYVRRLRHSETRDAPELTPREREVLQLMAEGLSNAGIAERLVVSLGAVEKHISNVFMKLDLEQVEHAHRRVLAVLTYLGDR